MNWRLLIPFALALLFLSLKDPNVINPDEGGYLVLAQQLASGSSFELYSHRFPFFPLIISLFYKIGFSIEEVRFLFPLLFMFAALATTYLLARRLSDRNTAFLATLILSVFPFFNRWGVTLLTDIPLIAISNLALLFLYERKPLQLGLATGFGLASKLTFAPLLLPISYFSLKWRLNPKLLFAGLLFSLLPFLLLQYTARQTATGINFSSLLSTLLQLGLAPVLLFIVFSKSTKETGFLWSVILSSFFLFIVVEPVFGFLHRAGLFVAPISPPGFNLRYISITYPLLSILAAVGYRNHRARKLFAATLLLTLFSSFLLLSVDNNTFWGVVELKDSLPAGRIAVEGSFVSYLQAYGFDTVQFKTFAGGVEITEILKVLQDPSDPRYGEYSKLASSNPRTFETVDLNYLKANNVNYVVLSLYGEFERQGLSGSYSIGPLKRPYGGGRIPPTLGFGSQLYNELEQNYTRVGTVARDGRPIFLIYKVT